MKKQFCKPETIGTYNCSTGLELPFEMVNSFGERRNLVTVDNCLVDEIKNLWSLGVETIGNCCGHYTIEMAYIQVKPSSCDKMIELGYEQIPPTYDCEGNTLGLWCFKPKSVMAYEVNDEN